jgi:hypothetical protein
MHSNVSLRLQRLAVHSPLLAGIASAALTFGQAAPPSQPAQSASHLPPVTAKLNALAHRVLNTGVKSNALDGDGLKPWHLKMDFQFVEAGMPKPVSGTMEEWATGPYQWKRTYTGAEPRLNGSEWSVSRTERYRTKPGGTGFNTAWANLRVARPVIAPLYQAANVKPDFEMEIKRVGTSGIMLNCVSVADPSRYADQADPDWLFPTWCFDGDMHLRLVSAGATSVQFDDIQAFQNHAVARDVRVIVDGKLTTEMKVSLLEPLAEADAERVKPDKDALSEPYTIEPGFPMPESVYEAAASLPIAPSGFPYQGVIGVPILILKDGSVKIEKGMGNPAVRVELRDAVELAVNKWKYKPYMVDGQPVEVAITASYVLNGKPFVPSYERPKPPLVTTSPEDFSSAYDPKRDPFKDLAMAEAQAKPANKRILIDVGGDWCIWCKTLDKFFADHADLRQQRDASFVLMKVNMSAINENYAFLSQYPKIPGYPWLFVLDSDGKLLKSEDTNELENGADGYAAKPIKDFLSKWKAE